MYGEAVAFKDRGVITPMEVFALCLKNCSHQLYPIAKTEMDGMLARSQFIYSVDPPVERPR